MRAWLSFKEHLIGVLVFFSVNACRSAPPAEATAVALCQIDRIESFGRNPVSLEVFSHQVRVWKKIPAHSLDSSWMGVWTHALQSDVGREFCHSLSSIQAKDLTAPVLDGDVIRVAWPANKKELVVGLLPQNRERLPALFRFLDRFYALETDPAVADYAWRFTLKSIPLTKGGKTKDDKTKEGKGQESKTKEGKGQESKAKEGKVKENKSDSLGSTFSEEAQLHLTFERRGKNWGQVQLRNSQGTLRWASEPGDIAFGAAPILDRDMPLPDTCLSQLFPAKSNPGANAKEKLQDRSCTLEKPSGYAWSAEGTAEWANELKGANVKEANVLKSEKGSKKTSHFAEMREKLKWSTALIWVE
jgi:hypothetical protein